jgi:hypothetical protein
MGSISSELAGSFVLVNCGQLLHSCVCIALQHTIAWGQVGQVGYFGRAMELEIL